MGVTTYVYPDYPSGICVYCGELADTVDHLLPKGFTGEADRKRVPVVPSCRECNSTLNDKYIPDVVDRREYVHSKYRTKYRRDLRAVQWGESDMAEFGPGIRLAIVRSQDAHSRAMQRLSWPHRPDYDYDAWRHAWESPEAYGPS